MIKDDRGKIPNYVVRTSSSRMTVTHQPTGLSVSCLLNPESSLLSPGGRALLRDAHRRLRRLVEGKKS